MPRLAHQRGFLRLTHLFRRRHCRNRPRPAGRPAGGAVCVAQHVPKLRNRQAIQRERPHSAQKRTEERVARAVCIRDNARNAVDDTRFAPETVESALRAECHQYERNPGIRQCCRTVPQIVRSSQQRHFFVRHLQDVYQRQGTRQLLDGIRAAAPERRTVVWVVGDARAEISRAPGGIQYRIARGIRC